MFNDYQKYAMSKGISSLTLHRYGNAVKDAIINPYIVEERTGNPLQIDVFSKLFTSRILFLGTEITDDVANIINSQLLYLQMDNQNAPIDLYLNTPGGSVVNGLSIYDTMNYIKCPVHTTCLGLAASMGSILLVAGEKGSRNALPHSRILIHQPLGGTGLAQASDIAIVNEQIQRYKEETFKILAEHSGNDYEKMVQLGDRDYWMTSPEAKELGIIDNVITKEETAL